MLNLPISQCLLSFISMRMCIYSQFELALPLLSISSMSGNLSWRLPFSIRLCSGLYVDLLMISTYAYKCYTYLWPLYLPMTSISIYIMYDLYTYLWPLYLPMTSIPTCDLYTYLWPLHLPLTSTPTCDFYTYLWSLHLPMTSIPTSDLYTYLELYPYLWPLSPPLTSTPTYDLYTYVWPLHLLTCMTSLPTVRELTVLNNMADFSNNSLIRK